MTSLDVRSQADRPSHHATAGQAVAHHHHHHAAPGVSSVLDIGGDVGALVVYLSAPTPSGELEACPSGRLDGRFHTGVHVRETGAGPAHVALFPEVAAGSYDVLDEYDVSVARVEVSGGSVSELDLRVH
jgi:hypothetical protein